MPAPMHAMGAPEGKKGSDMWGERGLTYGKNGGVWHLERMGGSGIWREQKGLHPRPLAHAGVRRTLEGVGGGGCWEGGGEGFGEGLRGGVEGVRWGWRGVEGGRGGSRGVEGGRRGERGVDGGRGGVEGVERGRGG